MHFHLNSALLNRKRYRVVSASSVQKGERQYQSWLINLWLVILRKFIIFRTSNNYCQQPPIGMCITPKSYRIHTTLYYFTYEKLWRSSYVIRHKRIVLEFSCIRYIGSNCGSSNKAEASSVSSGSQEVSNKNSLTPPSSLSDASLPPTEVFRLLRWLRLRLFLVRDLVGLHFFFWSRLLFVGDGGHSSLSDSGVSSSKSASLSLFPIVLSASTSKSGSSIVSKRNVAVNSVGSRQDFHSFLAFLSYTHKKPLYALQWATVNLMEYYRRQHCHYELDDTMILKWQSRIRIFRNIVVRLWIFI